MSFNDIDELMVDLEECLKYGHNDVDVPRALYVLALEIRDLSRMYNDIDDDEEDSDEIPY